MEVEKNTHNPLYLVGCQHIPFVCPNHLCQSQPAHKFNTKELDILDN